MKSKNNLRFWGDFFKIREKGIEPNEIREKDIEPHEIREKYIEPDEFRGRNSSTTKPEEKMCLMKSKKKNVSLIESEEKILAVDFPRKKPGKRMHPTKRGFQKILHCERKLNKQTKGCFFMFAFLCTK